MGWRPNPFQIACAIALNHLGRGCITKVPNRINIHMFAERIAKFNLRACHDIDDTRRYIACL